MAHEMVNNIEFSYNFLQMKGHNNSYHKFYNGISNFKIEKFKVADAFSRYVKFSKKKIFFR